MQQRWGFDSKDNSQTQEETKPTSWPPCDLICKMVSTKPKVDKCIADQMPSYEYWFQTQKETYGPVHEIV